MKIIFICILLLLCGCGKVVQETTDPPKEYVWVDQTFVPSDYVYTTPNSILVLGNSICYIPTGSTTEGFVGGCGMYASSVSKDYVHQLGVLLSANVVARNSWDIEQTYSTYDFTTLPTADMIIIQLGDNIANKYANYGIYLQKLIERYASYNVILTSTILNSNDILDPVNREILQAAYNTNTLFIDCRYILMDDANVQLPSGIPNCHPNDQGMKLLADRLYKHIRK